MAALVQRIEDVVGTIRNKINAMMPRLVPQSGATGQALVKVSAADYDTGWATIVGATRGLSVWCSGKPSDGEVIGGGVAPYSFSITQANCSAKAKVAFTASTTFIIRNDGSQIGTIVFGVGATLGTVTITVPSIAAGEFVSLHGPATADATGADIAILLRE